MDNIVQIKICTENAAFGDTYSEQATEIAGLLKVLISKLQDDPTRLDGTDSIGIFDTNGNRVGALITYKE